MTVNLTIRVLPFGTYEVREVIRLTPDAPVAALEEPVVLAPTTTIADYIVTSDVPLAPAA